MQGSPVRGYDTMRAQTTARTDPTLLLMIFHSLTLFFKKQTRNTEVLREFFILSEEMIILKGMMHL